MKKILFAITASCITMMLQAQTSAPGNPVDSVEVKLVEMPDSTAIGTPDGQSISKEIGISGGSISSADGRVELIFPAGALTAKTTISIQPITSLLPTGNGKGYNFEPSGIQFKKPVELIFHYSEEEAAACPPELKFMAIQSSNGKWEYMDYNDWDTATKSLRGSITHFSAFVNGNLTELSEQEVTLKTGRKHTFYLKLAVPPGAGEDDLPPLPFPLKTGNNEVIWKVNEQTGGNERLGKISLASNKKIRAVYTAPRVLVKEPVTVQLEITPYEVEEIIKRFGKKGKISTFKKTKMGDPVIFSCKVELYDEYRITAITTWPLLCYAEVMDSSSFVARIFPTRVKIENVRNGAPKLTKGPTCNTYKYLPEGCIGPTHVNAELVSKYYCSDDYPPKIELEFTSVEALILKTRVKVGKVTSETASNGQTWPGPISFVADGSATVSGITTGVLIQKLDIVPVK